VPDSRPVDSPVDWVHDHIREYEESDGERGHTWRGVPTLLLTVIGRRTGTPRRTALIYGEDGDRYVVVASKGGAREHPQWYRNLQANPEVEVQVGPRVLKAVARTADPDEKARLWPLMARIWPDYEAYQQRTDRDIPVVVLEPVA
jgi:deazaflavin-dependent oxidoreductase (nitroreductase family)